MVVVFEFFGEEPIENVITCMNYRVDKVIFFGYSNVIQKRKAATDKFLKKHCGVKTTEYVIVPETDLVAISTSIRDRIEREIKDDNDVYFDITGGEYLILVAFGMLAPEYDTPMHMYDVRKNQIIELDDGSGRVIDRDVKAKAVKLDINKYIELMGGVVNMILHKNAKNVGEMVSEEDIDKLWSVATKYSELWNPFSSFLRSNMTPDANLQVRRNAYPIVEKLNESKSGLNTVRELNAILDDLKAEGLILNLKHSDGKYEFTFKSEGVKELIWDGGSVLELHTYQTEKLNSDDCRVGVHLDWDGVIQNHSGSDVLNEIDVLAIKGNVPVFISCKSGNMEPKAAMNALYELQTVTKRFGGKYAKMVLATTQPLNPASMLRAEEMNIEVRWTNA